MYKHIKKSLPLFIINVVLGASLFFSAHLIPGANLLQQHIYDRLQRIQKKLRRPPPAIEDFLLVTIDNQTLKSMPQRWPYPRSTFAQVIQNLKKAQAKVIAFDFAFFGDSAAEEDDFLKTTIAGAINLILPALVDEDSFMHSSAVSVADKGIFTGFVTKIQDKDGVVRRNLTYLVSSQEPNKGFLSWEMQILKLVKGIEVASIQNNGGFLSFGNNLGEEWLIPVEPNTKSFLINFRGQTPDFKRLSFYDVLKGNFDTDTVKNKIVLIGVVSSLLADIYNTPIGFLPGVTINANALLNLYTRDFIKDVPERIEFMVVILGVIISTFFILWRRTKQAILLIAGQVMLFFILSYLLLIRGYLWNYFLFPCAVLLCPFFGQRIFYLLKALHPANKILARYEKI